MPEPSYAEGLPGRAGMFEHFGRLLSAKLAYLRARLELLGIEARDAALHYGIIVGLAIGMLVILVFGYLFLVIALVFLVAMLWENQHAWVWVLMGAALLHIGGALALGWIAKSRLTAPMFTASLEELRKDQEWLKTTAK